MGTTHVAHSAPVQRVGQDTDLLPFPPDGLSPIRDLAATKKKKKDQPLSTSSGSEALSANPAVLETAFLSAGVDLACLIDRRI